MRDPEIIIGVHPAGALDARPRLFATLARALGVGFDEWEPGAPVPAALIVFGDLPATVAGELTVPVFAVGGADAALAREEELEVDAGPIDPRLRGLVLRGTVTRVYDARAGTDVLATAASGPVWTRDARGHRLGVTLPELAPDEILRDALLYRLPLAAVALIVFLRTLTVGEGWRPAPLRASIVFDDPNLRRPSYGFINYRRLLDHADEHGYHAAMAMIPLDAGRPHGPTASLFASRRDRLSLVYHGNDHIRRELMTPADSRAAVALAAQALRRVTRFERRSGLSVDRVMMPPHGLCSEVMTGALGSVDFDALCAIHPLPWTEHKPADQLLLGMGPTQFVAGCPVIPRFPLGCSREEIAMRAFLDQPLVFYGHHDDLDGGLDLLARAAAEAARLGDVQWTSLGEIAQGGYWLRARGQDITIRPHGRRAQVTLPDEVRTLTVEAPRDAIDPSALSGWTLGDGPSTPFGTAVAAVPGTASLRLRGADDVNPESVRDPAWTPWPRLRRAAAEARDRALPLRRG